jgi:hypothetical protein
MEKKHKIINSIQYKLSPALEEIKGDNKVTIKMVISNCDQKEVDMIKWINTNNIIFSLPQKKKHSPSSFTSSSTAKSSLKSIHKLKNSLTSLLKSKMKTKEKYKISLVAPSSHNSYQKSKNRSNKCQTNSSNKCTKHW